MSPLLRINGAGKVDLPKEGIDYGLKVVIVGTSKGQGGTDLDDLKGLTIPVKITGTFDQPKPTVDIANLLKEQATEEMKSKIADKLEDKLGSDLGGLLGGVLGTKKSETTSAEPASQSAEAEPSQEQKPAQEEPAESPEDILKNKLKSLF